MSNGSNLHAAPTRPIAGEQDPLDRANARISQANAIANLLRGDIGEPGGGRMADHLVADALWAVNDLLEDAGRALNGGEG